MSYTIGTGGIGTNKLVIFSGSTVLQASTGATTGVIGINGATGASGTVGTITLFGSAHCVFSNATTAGHYVQTSTTTAGDCVDTGSTIAPTSNQILGIVNATNGSAGGTNLVTLFGPGHLAIPSAATSGNVAVVTGSTTDTPTSGFSGTVTGTNSQFIVCQDAGTISSSRDHGRPDHPFRGRVPSGDDRLHNSDRDRLRRHDLR